MSSKPFTVLTCEQRSKEWIAARTGVMTASRAGDAFARTAKGEWRAERKNYRTELTLERITGESQEDKRSSQAMRDGMEREALALRDYENIHGAVVRSVGFVLDNELPVGCSPDGVIGDFEGLVQAKCPLAATHLVTVSNLRAASEMPISDLMRAHGRLHLGAVPYDYLQQIRHELYVTGAAWCDYFSYHPKFPKTLQAVTIRVTRDDADLVNYANDVRAFLAEVDAECEKITGWAA